MTTRRTSMLAVAGGAALLATFVGLHRAPDTAFASYLFAYFFWLDVSLGALAIHMIQGLTGGRWGDLVRGPFEAAARVLPWLALLAIPLVFGLSDLYPWLRPDAAHDPVLQQKSWYLSRGFFLARAAAYFVVWIVLAYRAALLGATARASARRRRANIAGVLLYAVTVSFASVDWVMSLIPEWYSTTFGLLVGTGQLLVAMAFGILMATLDARAPPADRLNDLGNLLLTFVLCWVYIAFTQYLIIWSGNLPDGIAWFLPRRAGGYQWVGAALILFHFAVPFAVLLLRSAKRNAFGLGVVAALVLAAHVIDTYWLIVPSVRRAGATLYWTDVTAFIGIGAIWLAAYGARPDRERRAQALAMEKPA
ncbi:MAG: hypothetical protein ACJ8NR_05825 [Sulfurifustis sp.]